MYPDGLGSPDYTSVINDAHLARLRRLVADARDKGAQVIDVFRPDLAARSRSMMPVLILDPRSDMLALRDEIFGPVLPIVGYETIDDAIAMISAYASPLALYYFGKNDEHVRAVLDRTASGGVTINDVMTHMFVDDLPFGGIGRSGMGAYRGEAGFRNFSHARAIYRQTDAKEAVALFHPPYSDQFRAFVSAAIAGPTPS
jgi:coniferyl-aldehyde dehydrogenase